MRDGLRRASLGILHLTTFLQGGAGRAITDLACAQHAAGHRVTVVTSLTGSADVGNYPEYLERLGGAGVVLHRCDSLFTRDLALNMRVVEMLCASVDIHSLDVMHAHAAIPTFIARLFAERMGRQVPIVQTQHGWGINKTAEQAAFDIDVLRRVDQVITTSRATADVLVSLGAPAASMLVIPCGLPPADGVKPPAEALHALAPLRGRGTRVVGCIGSVTVNKNQRLLVEALASLTDLDVAAVFVGEGGDALLEQARALGVGDRVMACGYQAEASAWLPLFDLLVLPSRTEGQGLVVLEAFRAGVPVVASRIPALAELIDSGRNGFLFEGDDAGALAAKIRRALTLTSAGRAAMAGAGRERFQTEFSLERMVARHEEMYRVMLDHRVE